MFYLNITNCKRETQPGGDQGCGVMSCSCIGVHQGSLLLVTLSTTARRPANNSNNNSWGGYKQTQTLKSSEPETWQSVIAENFAENKEIAGFHPIEM
jgi:hypothetical protein